MYLTRRKLSPNTLAGGGEGGGGGGGRAGGGPEYTCDLGIKKVEKIDYAIHKDGQPIILIECKHWKEDLTSHNGQLFRYFHVSNARFGILTNGIIYRFYTDLVEKNKMDEKPFFEFNMEKYRESQVDKLREFHKSYFYVDTILSTA